MEYGIEEKIFNQNQFFEGNQDTRPRLDELRAIQEQRTRGDDVIVGDASAIDIVEFVVKRAGLLGHRLITPLVEVWAEALLEHVADVAEGNPLKYVNPNWDHPARVRHPEFRDAAEYKDKKTEPEDENADDPDLVDDGGKHVNGYRKPVTAEEAEDAKKESDRVRKERESGNVASEKDDDVIRKLLES